MNNEPTTPTRDFNQPETFKFILDFDSFIKRQYPTLGALAFLSFIIFTAIINAIGLPAPYIFGLIVTAGFTYFLYQAKKKQYHTIWSAATMTFSSEGIVTDEVTQRTTLPWDKIRGFGLGDFTAGASVPGLGMSDSARAATNFANSTSAKPVMMLQGFGTIEIKDHGPKLAQEALKQQLSRVEKDENGKPLCVAAISYYEKDWKNGRIGEWVNHFRPDLKGIDNVPSNQGIAN